MPCDHATKTGSYTCDDCSRARQKLKHEKAKSQRQSKIVYDTLEPKRQVDNYDYDPQIYSSKGEKFLSHYEPRRNDHSRGKDYWSLIEELRSKYPEQSGYEGFDVDDLEDLLFKLRNGFPVENKNVEIGSEFDYKYDKIDDI